MNAWIRTVCAATAASLLLAACAAGGTSNSDGSQSGDDAAAGGPSDPTGLAQEQINRVPGEPSSVDQVTWNLPFGEPISLDPLQSYNYSENTVLSNMCEALIRVTPEFTYEPGLAESWEQTSENSWTYTIRDGVTFWDGTPMTAEDVAYSLNRHLDPEAGSFYAEPFVAQISSVEQTDDRQVTVTTEHPTVLIHEMMATGLGTVIQRDYAENSEETYGTPDGGIMCTGPFEFESWNSGSDLTMTRHEDYWDVENAAHAEQFSFRFITDTNTLTNALVSGEIDGTYQAPVTAVDQLRNSDAGDLYLGHSTQTYLLYPTGTGALGDPDVRQALSLVIDRAAIADTVFSGTAAPLRSVFLLPIPYAYARQTFADAYEGLDDVAVDVEAAQELIGDGSFETIRLGIQAEDATSQQIANAVVSAGEQLGLSFDIRQFPAGEFIGMFFDPVAREEIDAMLTTGYSDVPDPIEYFEMVAMPGSVQNFSNYDNPTVTDSIIEARGTTDEEERAELVLQAQQAVDEDLPIIPILYIAERLSLSSDLTGAPVPFPYQYHPWAAAIGSAG